MENLSKEVKEKTKGYILTALGLVAGLAWNDAIKALIDSIFKIDKNTIIAKFIYATIITVIVVTLATSLLRSDAKK
ncbi:MAG: hypothetical protein COV29_03715 [Candidatus Yanofskybacteria bacterium CG10_big_fil_rev_8_21_14_0_10_36_16]|uniref:Uncharacterized protein n=1 Tax=Candidatus Yanofskybacteria bacterium CG10_big_fil_rev_8_21_14_0_10_36_16 TaxID=1975096 RepID=A0A2J0Q6K2_9BACT|nr:MAG: hypothetical protein COV29_03715 [Candidatus Yanofskybacteria bacterium CG10_big_fil_rev_8_21_14_0_10_36_16]